MEEPEWTNPIQKQVSMRPYMAESSSSMSSVVDDFWQEMPHLAPKQGQDRVKGRIQGARLGSADGDPCMICFMEMQSGDSLLPIVEMPCSHKHTYHV